MGQCFSSSFSANFLGVSARRHVASNFGNKACNVEMSGEIQCFVWEIFRLQKNALSESEPSHARFICLDKSMSTTIVSNTGCPTVIVSEN